MKLFIATFKGVWGGGTAVIAAESKEHALEMLRSRLPARMNTGPYFPERKGTPDPDPQIEELDITAAGILHFDDGDY